MNELDCLIRGGKVIDGTGSPWRRMDIAVRDGFIVGLGRDLPVTRAEVIIDARDKYVSPGFIDAHSHADITLLADERMQYRIMQGITTEVVGQDGLSYAPANDQHLKQWRKYLKGLNGEYADRVSWDWNSTAELLDKYEGRASNAVHLAPHGAIRVEVMGWDDRPASPEELSRMQELVRRSLEEGAAGISTGLTYIPCSHAETAEMVALCQPVGDMGGVLSIHLRSYAGDLLNAVDEAISMGRSSGAAIHISHLRMADPSTWGLAEQVLGRIDRARQQGIDVTFDVYPYTVGCAPLFCLLPAWAQAGGPDSVLGRLRDDELRNQIKADMDSWNLDWSNYSLSNAPDEKYLIWEGQPLSEAASTLKSDVPALLMDVLLKTSLDATIIAAGGNETDNLTMLKHSAAMIGSDGVLVGGQPHPRGFGTYPRLLTEYVRDNQVLELEEAIHKMTAFPARRHGIQDRGVISIGSAADLVVFSLDTMRDHATYQNPLQVAEGVHSVLINGKIAVSNGDYLGSSYGKALRPLPASLEGGL